MPNLLPLSTYCVRLEPRPLPSTGITRLHRYYGPIRHRRPVGRPRPHQGVSRVARAFLVYMLPPLPRRSGCVHTCSIPQPYQSSTIQYSDRPTHRPFRGLLGVHSRCGLHTRAATNSWHALPEGFNHFVTSIVAPVASGWSFGRVGLTPTGKRRLFTAHTGSGHSPISRHGQVCARCGHRRNRELNVVRHPVEIRSSPSATH